jgi:hypothetical protein
MRLITVLSCLALLALMVQTGLSVPVSIFVIDQEQKAVGNAIVTVYLADGTPVDSGSTSPRGIFQTFLNESSQYSIVAARYDETGSWDGIPGSSRKIQILIAKDPMGSPSPW